MNVSNINLNKAGFCFEVKFKKSKLETFEKTVDDKKVIINTYLEGSRAFGYWHVSVWYGEKDMPELISNKIFSASELRSYFSLWKRKVVAVCDLTKLSPSVSYAIIGTSSDEINRS